MKFNSAQRSCIECEDNLSVLAPPGSGKTGMLVAKCVHILRQSPANIVGMQTFTNAATKELSHRLKQLLTPSEFKRVLVATFHSHCMEMLRAAKKLGKLIGPNEMPSLIRQAMTASDYIGTFEEAVAEIEVAKRDVNFSGNETALVQAYESIRARHRALDLNDVVREAVKQMQAGEIPHLPVTHLLGDEFQDSDKLQVDFMLAHAHAGVIVTIVSDDDQSIYSFRGSLGYEGILRFEKEAPARRILLEINYRSNSEILDAAAAVIQHNVSRVPKIVSSAKGPGGQVKILRVASRSLECKTIADMIMEDVEPVSSGEIIPPTGRWAVIARANSSFRLLVGELKAVGIAYHRLGGSDEIPEDAQVLMNFLCTLQSGDSLGLETMLTRAGIHHTAASSVIHQFGNECYRFLDGELPNLDRPQPEDDKLIKQIAMACARWRNLLADGHYERVIDGVAYWFLDNGLVKSKTPDEDFNFWVGLLKRTSGSLARRTEKLLRKKDNKDGTGVTLTTMHTSKGLEFDNVLILQANAGTVPSPKNPSVEEERRLFFVAMTRARQRLWVLALPAPNASPFVVEMERAGVTSALAVSAS